MLKIFTHSILEKSHTVLARMVLFSHQHLYFSTWMYIILHFFGLIGYHEISDILLKKSTSQSTEED